MNSQSRLLRTLLLFSETRPQLTLDEIAAASGASRNTTYRDLQVLRRHGFTEPGTGDRVILGGAISALDRLARTASPLLRAGAPEMERLAARTGRTVTLTRLYGNAVIGLGQALGDPALSIGYERGQIVPLFRGCTGKVILSALPWRQLRRIHADNRAEIEAAGLNTRWEDFRATVRGFARTPFLWTEGEINPANLAIATALRDLAGAPLGSLTIIIRRALAASIDRPHLEQDILAAREAIEAELALQSVTEPTAWP